MRALCSMGTLEANVHVAEWNPEAAARLRSRFPMARVVAGDVEEACSGNAYDVMSLDWCANISRRSLEKTRTCLRSLRNEGAAVLWWSYGRESTGYMGTFSALAAEIKAHTRCAGEVDPALVRALFALRWLHDSDRTASYRALSLTKYSSGRTPMVVAVLHKRSWPKPRPGGSRALRKQRAALVHLQRTQWTYTAWPPKWNDLTGCSQEDARAEVRRLVLGAQGARRLRIQESLSVDPRTAAAWRAHETMGTYQRDGDAILRAESG